MAGKHRLARRGFATLLALGVSTFALSQQPALGEARAMRADPAAVGQTPLEPRVRRWLSLSLPRRLEVDTRATVRVEGAANAGDELSVFVDPKGGECPSSASAPPVDAISLVSEVANDGVFRVTAAYTPRRLGDRSFCAYLGASSQEDHIQTSVNRRVIAQRLRASSARRTVVTALKRHGFAHRVVKAVKPDCHRRSRTEFACEFSADFPGYELKGRGRVRQDVGLSYRFRVKAQGVHLTLTDENEEPHSN
jgi:hypothetical protein